MTKLKCNACNCSYNDDYYCCIDGINVGGQDATKDEHTCCENFVQSDGSMTNCQRDKKPSMAVGCEATNCVHNDDCKCHADEICICGDHACDCGETKCDTFKCK